MDTHTRLGGLLFLVLTVAACSSSSRGSSSAAGTGTGAPGGGGGGSTAGSAHFFLPVGDALNTAAPTIALDGNDGIHTVYPAYAGSGAYYGFCASSCSGPDDVKLVPFVTDGTVHNAMLALDATGKPHVLLSGGQRVHYASCEGDCTDPKAWTTTVIVEHGGAREVTGKAFALDPKGRPRFLMHTYKAYLGVGQKPPETLWVSCDAGCTSADRWSVSKITDQMWRSSHLVFDAQGRAHAATVANVGRTESSSGKEVGAYAVCEGDCTQEASWVGTTLDLAFESTVDAVAISPSISLAFTKAGAPRIAMLAQYEDTLKRNLTYYACDERCTEANWRGRVLTDGDELGAGVDLALDANDHPRLVATVDYDIRLATCDDATCDSAEARWNVGKVESGSDLKPDEIFLYTNCTVGAWFLHSPSLALTRDGRPRVGYQARDISGGLKNPDPARLPDCRAGTDLTWSRLAVLPSAG